MSFWLEDEGLTNDALGMIVSEDLAQREKWGNQRYSIYKWLTILGEEVGELNGAVLDIVKGRGDEDHLKHIELEATQVATVALKIAWMARNK